jgi:hypothetical protein
MSIWRNARNREDLLRIVSRVRRRWRMKLLLRGFALTLAGALLTFLISASTLEALRFQPEAILALRVLLWLVIGFFMVRTVFWPLVRRVSDERVALYLEENEPSLKSQVMTAVETAGDGQFEKSQLLQEVVRRAARQWRSTPNSRSPTPVSAGRSSRRSTTPRR